MCAGHGAVKREKTSLASAAGEQAPGHSPGRLSQWTRIRLRRRTVDGPSTPASVLGGDHDLLLGRCRLGVVALHPAACRLDVARVQVAEVDLARRRIGGLIGLGRPAEPAAVLHHSARAVRLVFGVRATLDLELLFEPALSLDQPLGARAWDRPGLLRATLI